MKPIQVRWYSYDPGHEPPDHHLSVDSDTMPEAIRAVIANFELTEDQIATLEAFQKITAYPRHNTHLHTLGIWCWAGPRGWIGPDWA